MISVRNPPKEKPEIHRIIKKFQAFLCSNWQFTGQSASSWGLYLESLHNASWCFTITALCDFQIFVILRESPLLSRIWCQFAVLGEFLLSIEVLSRALLRWLKNIQCCSQSFKRFLFFLFGCFGINVHRSLDVFMPHNRLDNLQVGLFFAKPCTECVTQIVCRKVWKQNRITVLFLWCHFFARIVICNDALDSTIYRFSSLHNNNILIVKQKVKFRICPSEFSNVQFMALITEYEMIPDSVQKSHSLPKQPCQFCKQL